MASANPIAPAFHRGERLLQDAAGLGERMAEIGPRVIRRAMPEQHRAFFAELPFLLVGSVVRALPQAHALPHATVLAGPPGFITSPNPTTLHIALGASTDAAEGLVPGVPVGLLGIQFDTRRRNRANGMIVARDADGATVHITQSFGNCPKYITPRHTQFDANIAVHRARSVEGPLLSNHALSLIRNSDTFFIASAADDASNEAPLGVDMSHRGGHAGFVSVRERAGQSVLTVPDYSGNYFFNTLGNLLLYPHAALLFIDFASRDVLTLHVDTALVRDETEGSDTGRALSMNVRGGTLASASVPLRFSAA